MKLKSIVSFSVLFFTSFYYSYSQYDSIIHDGYQRTYLVHLPTGYSGSTNLPLLIAMHGGLGNAYNLAYQSQLSLKANNENFIVVYPEGLSGGLLNASSWNAGWCCGFASNSNIDDVGFINALLDTLTSSYAIDTLKIYATGMSNGGYMTYRLACELSNRFAAISAVSASMSMQSCNPQRPVPIISFHSYQDFNVPVNGGIGSGISNHYNTPQDSIMNAWSVLNGCFILNDTIISNNEYDEIHWKNCNCNSEIHQYLTQDGGHSWPGGNQTITGDSVSNFINANDLMWSFFQQYSLECDSSNSTIYELNTNNIKVYPNPTNGTFQIEFLKGFSNDYNIQIFDITGRKINDFQYQNKQITINKKGVFILKIYIGNTIQLTQKMIVK